MSSAPPPLTDDVLLQIAKARLAEMREALEQIAFKANGGHISYESEAAAFYECVKIAREALGHPE